MFELGERKLQGVRRAIILTIPRVWVLNHGLQKQDLVNITVGDDGSLIIKPVEKAGGGR